MLQYRVNNQKPNKVDKVSHHNVYNLLVHKREILTSNVDPRAVRAEG